MIPSQYITIGKWIAIVGLIGTVYFTIRNHGHALAENDALHDKLDQEIAFREAAEARADDLSQKLQEFQRIDQQRQRELAEARRLTDSAVRDIEALSSDTPWSVCNNTLLPPGLVDRMLEASHNRVRVPD